MTNYLYNKPGRASLKRASKEGAGVKWISPATVLDMVLPMLNELPGALIR